MSAGVVLTAARAVCSNGREYTTVTDEERKIIAAERPVGVLLWIWNFHPTQSHEGLRVETHSKGRGWRVLTSSDDARFGGHARVAQAEYGDTPVIYVPTRTCIVLVRCEPAPETK